MVSTKIKLLNDGGYESLKNVKFPVVVNGFEYDGLEHCVGVMGNELLLIGADKDAMYDSVDLSFLIGEECEIADE